MYTRNKQLQYTVRVDAPDPKLAVAIQELIGGHYGEMSVMMQYLFQGWGLRGDKNDVRLARLKDMLLDTAMEEIAHVEMVATCAAMLLSGDSDSQDKAAQKSKDLRSIFENASPQHAIVTGLGALPADSMGNPWSGSYIVASGNVVPDLYDNAAKEMNGRLQACRVYELTDDTGVRDMLKFMIARDHMHQLQWLAALDEFGGRDAALPTPADFPLDQEDQKYAYAFMAYAQNPSDTKSGEGPWAQGQAPDGKGTFNYIAEPFAVGQEPHLPAAPAVYHSAPPKGEPTNLGKPGAQTKGVSNSAQSDNTSGTAGVIEEEVIIVTPEENNR